jgi:hypothetical protein
MSTSYFRAWSLVAPSSTAGANLDQSAVAPAVMLNKGWRSRRR